MGQSFAARANAGARHVAVASWAGTIGAAAVVADVMGRLVAVEPMDQVTRTRGQVMWLCELQKTEAGVDSEISVSTKATDQDH